MLKCKFCGKEFEVNIERHYVARDDGKTGISAAFSRDEECLYDAFDCPYCGCQYIIGERKRKKYEISNNNYFDSPQNKTDECGDTEERYNNESFPECYYYSEDDKKCTKKM